MNACELTQKQIAMMSAADRRALGVLTPDQRTAKVEARGEKELQKLCEQELSRRGIVYLHLSFRARESVGWPDIVCCIAGRPLAIELKTTTGKLSFDQATMLNCMESNGWTTRVCRSFEQFVEIITAEK